MMRKVGVRLKCDPKNSSQLNLPLSPLPKMSDYLEDLGASPEVVKRVMVVLEAVGVNTSAFLQRIHPSSVGRLVPPEIAALIENVPSTNQSVANVAALVDALCGEPGDARPLFPSAGLYLPNPEQKAEGGVGSAEEAEELRGMSIAGALSEIARRVADDPFYASRTGRAYVLTWLRLLHPSIGTYQGGVFVSPLFGAFRPPKDGPWAMPPASHAVEHQLNPIMIFSQLSLPLFVSTDGVLTPVPCSEDSVEISSPGFIAWSINETNIVSYLLQLRFIAMEASTRLSTYTITPDITPQRQAAYDNDAKLMRGVISRLWQGERAALKCLPPCLYPAFESFLFRNDMPNHHGRTILVYTLVHAGIADRRDVISRIERVCETTERFVKRNSVEAEKRSILRHLARRNADGRQMLGCKTMQSAQLCGTLGTKESIPDRVHAPVGSDARARLVADIEDIGNDPCERCTRVASCQAGRVRAYPIRHPIQFVKHMSN